MPAHIIYSGAARTSEETVLTREPRLLALAILLQALQQRRVVRCVIPFGILIKVPRLVVFSKLHSTDTRPNARLRGNNRCKWCMQKGLHCTRASSIARTAARICRGPITNPAHSARQSGNWYSWSIDQQPETSDTLCQARSIAHVSTFAYPDAYFSVH